MGSGRGEKEARKEKGERPAKNSAESLARPASASGPPARRARKGAARRARAHPPGAAAGGPGRRASRQQRSLMPTAESALMEESCRVARTSASESLSPATTASSLSAGTRKNLILSAPTSQPNLADARSARSAITSPWKMGSLAKTASTSPARLTKTLPASAPAAAAGATGGG